MQAAGDGRPTTPGLLPRLANRTERDIRMAGATTEINDLREVAPGIYYANGPLVAADGAVVSLLKQAARENPVRRARLCAHSSPDATQHDMLIVSHRETYVAPHRHRGRTETMVVVEGEADAVVFDENGAVTERLRLGAAGSGRTFFYRMPPQRFHSLRVRSELLVFLESTVGPFQPDSTEFADWAPQPHEAEAGRRYLDRLLSGG